MSRYSKALCVCVCVFLFNIRTTVSPTNRLTNRYQNTGIRKGSLFMDEEMKASLDLQRSLLQEKRGRRASRLWFMLHSRFFPRPYSFVHTTMNTTWRKFCQIKIKIKKSDSNFRRVHTRRHQREKGGVAAAAPTFLFYFIFLIPHLFIVCAPLFFALLPVVQEGAVHLTCTIERQGLCLYTTKHRSSP